MESLERLLNMVDERRETPPLLRTFECIRRDLLAETDQLKEIYAREELDGYRRVRKVHCRRSLMFCYNTIQNVI